MTDKLDTTGWTEEPAEKAVDTTGWAEEPAAPEPTEPAPEPGLLQNIADWATGKPHQGKPLGDPNAVVAPATPEQMEAAKAQTDANLLGSRTATKKALTGTLLSGLSFPSLGAIPALSGAVRAVPTALADYVKRGRMGAPFDIGAAYRKERDSAKNAMDAAVEEHPYAQIAGALATAPPSAGSALARLGVGAAQMGAQGFFNSPGDLTKGEYKQVASDTGKAALGGLAAAGLAEGVGAIPRLLSNRGAALEQRGLKTAADRTQAALDKAVRSASGTVGGETQSGSRMLENALRVVQNPQTVSDPAALQAAQDFIASPQGMALASQIAKSSATRGATQLGNITSAEAALQAAQAAKANPAVAAKLTQDELAKGGYGPLAKKLATRLGGFLGATGGGAIGAGLGGMLGEAVGGPETAKWGATAGGGLGMLGGGLLGGKPGTVLANEMRKPGTQQAVGQTMQAVGNFAGGVNDRINNALRAGIMKLLEQKALKPKVQEEETAQDLLANKK